VTVRQEGTGAYDQSRQTVSQTKQLSDPAGRLTLKLADQASGQIGHLYILAMR
jgi:hypothetical protein